jgi:Fe2+ transport system protein B
VTQTKQAVLVLGKESAGKSQLVSSLTGKHATAANFPGATVACERYAGGALDYFDTPGILQQADSEAARRTLARLDTVDVILLVVSATHLDRDLADLLPLASGKRGAVVVTFWDKVEAGPAARAALAAIERETGVWLVPVDARWLTETDRRRIVEALTNPAPFPAALPRHRTGWRIQPPPSLFERRLLGPLAALVTLLAPAAIAVSAATALAGMIDPVVQGALAVAKVGLSGWPAPLAHLLVGTYGLLTMGPLLFVWATPTVVLYAVLLGVLKASGVLDRATAALHPTLRPFGLSGRDLVRVVMGFGCNVPAVVASRACPSCTRDACIGAIAFGAACSYQLGATLGVFAAVGMPWLMAPYLAYLALTTLLVARLSAPAAVRSPLNALAVEGRAFLEWPRLATVWPEAATTLDGFFRTALPVFVAICAVAALLDWAGIVAEAADALAPTMAVLRLPAEAALPVLVAAVRKDGILLFASEGVAATLRPGQLLAGVYLAGVLLPCLVTCLTIARERSGRFALQLAGRQALAALAFTVVLAWATAALGW